MTLPPQLAASKAVFATHTVTVKLELCDAHCDRYYDVDPDQTAQRWNTIKSCLLGGNK